MAMLLHLCLPPSGPSPSLLRLMSWTKENNVFYLLYFFFSLLLFPNVIHIQLNFVKKIYSYINLFFPSRGQEGRQLILANPGPFLATINCLEKILYIFCFM